MILDYIFVILLGIVTANLLFKGYMLFFGFRAAPDDWFERGMSARMMFRYSKSHPGFVGRQINLSSDKFYITRDKDGNLMRQERGDV